jgi:hypothetical protein
MEINPGDLVMLKCGGPTIVVDRVHKGTNSFEGFYVNPVNGCITPFEARASSVKLVMTQTTPTAVHPSQLNG